MKSNRVKERMAGKSADVPYNHPLDPYQLRSLLQIHLGLYDSMFCVTAKL